MLKKILISLSFILVAVSTIYFLTRRKITIGPGVAGVVINDWFGLNENLVLEEGVNFVSILDSIVIYDIREQIIVDEIEASFEDETKAMLQINLIFKIRKDQLLELHQLYGKSYKEKYLIPKIISTIRSSTNTIDSGKSTEKSIEMALMDAISISNNFDYFEVKKIDVSTSHQIETY